VSFPETAFAQFISTTSGRVVRIVAGLALIAWGYTQRADMLGIALMIVGLVPLAAGALDICVMALFFGGPFAGRKIRAMKRSSP
jgi:Inner membrane protein YgaP-like, transmembrane domain